LNIFGGGDEHQINDMNKKKSGGKNWIKTQQSNNFSPRNRDLIISPKRDIKVSKFQDSRSPNIEKKGDELKDKIRIETSDNISQRNFLCNTPSQSATLSNLQSERRPSRVYFIKKNSNIKKLFRLESNKLRCQTPAMDEERSQVRYLNLEEKDVEK